MSVEILATEATLKTLSVSIQALMVSGKQMTLAVFRQLPSKDPPYFEDHWQARKLPPYLTGSGDLLPNARFWGRVNYNIRNEGDHWLVIEQDGRLWRAYLLSMENIKTNRWENQFQVRTEILEIVKGLKSPYGTYATYDENYTRLKHLDYPQRIKQAEEQLNLARIGHDQESKMIPRRIEATQLLLALPQLFIAV